MKPWGLILAFVFMRPLYQNRERIQAKKNKKKRFDFLARGGLHVPCQKIMSRKK
jgi:hypothetical protein